MQFNTQCVQNMWQFGEREREHIEFVDKGILQWDAELGGSSICNLNFFHFFKWILQILTKIRCSVKNKSPLLFPTIAKLQFKHFLWRSSAPWLESWWISLMIKLRLRRT